MSQRGRFLVTCLLLLSCAHRKPLQEQLNIIFSDHLKQVDTAAKLDSVHILFNMPVTQRLGGIIDDTVYMREHDRIKAQLVNAQQANRDKDSIAFYLYELNYMDKEIDSISKFISRGDTSRKYGVIIACRYWIRKNGKSIRDSTFVFIDSTEMMASGEYLDSSLRRTVRRFQ